MTPDRCAKALDESLAGSATVKFVLDALAKAGCPVTRSFFTVETCDAKVVGGFRPGDGVRRRRESAVLTHPDRVCSPSRLR